ncbi:MAG: hypothetical protein KJO13_03735 [Gammaproteobacteria bacterium]|nr:hypothetical protein [Gammaproteobacteria bacterium]
MLAEVLQGLRTDKHRRRARKRLLSLTVAGMPDTGIALKRTTNFRTVGKKKSLCARRSTKSSRRVASRTGCGCRTRTEIFSRFIST